MLLGGNCARFPTNLIPWTMTETSKIERHLRPVPEQSMVVPDDPVMVTTPLTACEAFTRELQFWEPLKIWEGSDTLPPAALSIILCTVSKEQGRGKCARRQMDIASHAERISGTRGKRIIASVSSRDTEYF